MGGACWAGQSLTFRPVPTPLRARTVIRTIPLRPQNQLL
jgi:hypothetical protein